MSQDFARNQWYVAAYSDEVGDGLLARTVLGEAIVLFRTSDGDPVALSDNCVHRRFPLSEGRRVDDTIVCGYHGFTYEPSGACIRVPGQDRIPRTARVPSYRVHEQDSFVWIWIGDPALADASAIPAAPWFLQEGWATIRGLVHLGARYGLLLDNLMDLSHEAFLHDTSIGSPEVADVPITTEVDDVNQVVYVSRHMDDSACPPLFARFLGITGRITRWQDIAYYPPGFYELHSRIAPQGNYPPNEGLDKDAFHLEIFNAITPETETTTLHFWGVARDFAVDDPELSESLLASNSAVIQEDVRALERLERHLAYEAGSYQELSVNLDTGGLAARRLLRRQIEHVELAKAYQ
jgi:vanillate O-demethylase monooxygenase subunit